MLTILVAVGGVFIILAGWALVDILARKQLGERHRHCSDHQPGCVCCQDVERCTLLATPEENAEDADDD
jgi:hypothetical protein